MKRIKYLKSFKVCKFELRFFLIGQNTYSPPPRCIPLLRFTFSHIILISYNYLKFYIIYKLLFMILLI